MAISLKGTKYTIPIDHSMYAIQKKERQPRNQLHHMFIKYTIQNIKYSSKLVYAVLS